MGSGTRAPGREAGVTLLELLVVVVIVSLLGLVAVTTYAKHRRAALGAQASAMLTEIAGRQEAYFTLYSRYLAIPTFHPALVPGEEPKAKPWAPAPPEWSQLGVADPGQTYFQFQVLAGAPGQAIPGGVFGVTATNLDSSAAWFIARAQGDLKGDGTLSTYVITSGRSTVISSE